MRRKILSCFMTLGLVVLLCDFSYGYPTKYIAALNAVQVVPYDSSRLSGGRGTCRAQIIVLEYDEGSYLQVRCDFSGLSGALIDADIRLASAGQNEDWSYCAGLGGETKEVLVSLPNNGSGSAVISCYTYNGYGSWIPPGDLLEKKLYVDLRTANFPNGEVRGQIKPVTLDSDVDGEGRAEVSVFRPSDGVSYAYCSMNNSLIATYLVQRWQPATDSAPFLADYNGDGLAERVFVRTNPVNGNLTFIYRWSGSFNILQQYPWGSAALGDIPVAGDFNGDGKTEIAVFRATTGVWHILVDSYDRLLYWGQPGGTDKPCPADYDGDGTTDLCVIREENGQFAWYIRRSTAPDQIYKVMWGLGTDTFFPNQPVDVDADGANDVLVMRETNGQRYFYALRSSDKSLFALQWGLPTDMVKIGDYDADGKTDFAAVREIDNQLVWFIKQSSNNQMRSFTWGLPGDK